MKLHYFLWPLSLVIAFFLGQHFSKLSLHFDDDKLKTSYQKESLSPSHSFTKQNDKETPHQQVIVTDIAQFSLDNTLEKLTMLMEKSSGIIVGLEQSALVYSLLHQTPNASVIAMIEAIANEPNSDINVLSLGYLYGRLAQVNGQVAAEHLATLKIDSFVKVGLEAKIYQQWAINEPEVALDFYLAQKDQSLYDVGLLAIISTIAKQDINLAMDKIKQLHDEGHNIKRAVTGIAQSFTENYQYQDLIQALNTLKDERVVQGILSAWALKEPQAVADWLTVSADEDNRLSREERLLSTWFSKDFSSAADWYIGSKTDEKSRNNAISKILLRQSYTTNVDVLKSWLEKQPDINFVDKMKELVTNTARRNPQFSEKHFDILDTEKQRIDTAFDIYNGYKRQNSKVAQDYLNSSPYKSEILKRLARIKKYEKASSWGY
ncbi:hypothetical protein Q4489_02845 [Thalassotalea sp. 1_MG-2023]|uniref:hypothetical protein n=1 Tax=Thalassotalea sp. 1_MG-2023 TaxID=3062680 RepID=UPI0026E1712F|nr:hypothetical protein [Thalassotalea sp. 1_MG-2023]MDO6425929.1 hypothetical protein [Thalassotalea sp. 1_MG-2023]